MPPPSSLVDSMTINEDLKCNNTPNFNFVGIGINKLHVCEHTNAIQVLIINFWAWQISIKTDRHKNEWKYTTISHVVHNSYW